MKKYVYLTLALVLTAALLVGCGCTNRNMGNTSAPTVLPTNEEIWDTSESTTRATTEATAPSATDRVPGNTNETIDRGNGPLEDSTTAPSGSTESTNAAESHARNAGPNMR